MKVVFGCDPNAQEFKEHLMEFVKGLGHEVADFEAMIQFTQTRRLNWQRQLQQRNLTEEFLYAVQVLVYQLQQIK